MEERYAHTQKFGMLTVLQEYKNEKGYYVCMCRCDCGSMAFVTGRNLVRGYTKSCGCYLKEKQDIAGQQFGKLTALYPDKVQEKNRPRKWICQCDCGGLCSVAISNLRNGHTQSCGCLGEIEYRNLIEDTCLEIIASKTISKNNRSGVKGVSYYSRTDSWVATLTFKGKHYFLGKFGTIAEAAKARRRAEEELINPFLEKYSHLILNE